MANPSGDAFLRLLLGGAQRGVDVFQERQTRQPQQAMGLLEMLQQQQLRQARLAMDKAELESLERHRLATEAQAAANAATAETYRGKRLTLEERKTEASEAGGDLPSAVREYLFALTPEGGAFKGSFIDFAMGKKGEPEPPKQQFQDRVDFFLKQMPDKNDVGMPIPIGERRKKAVQEAYREAGIPQAIRRKIRASTPKESISQLDALIAKEEAELKKLGIDPDTLE